MIIVRLMGGLGNQMFQYAVGKALSIENDVPLKFDVFSLAKHDTKDSTRNYFLDKFNMDPVIATEQDISYFTTPRVYNIFLYKLFRIFKKEKYVIRQKLFPYESVSDPSMNNCYLSGYWQSYKYFQKIHGIIKEEFTIKDANINKYSYKLLEIITDAESVSMHIRRGDYLENTMYNVLDCSYYTEAIKFINSKVRNYKLFIFSDDINWCRNNMKFETKCTFVEENDTLISFRLMKNCKHNIIANSSYSWWAAWLNGNKNKIVIAPTKWVNDNNFKIDDLIPKDWNRIVV